MTWSRKKRSSRGSCSPCGRHSRPDLMSTLLEPGDTIDQRERCYTAADLAAMPDELPSGPVRYELDNGRLISMAPPGSDHGSVELRIGSALLVQGECRGHGIAKSATGVILWRDPDRVVA